MSYKNLIIFFLLGLGFCLHAQEEGGQEVEEITVEVGEEEEKEVFKIKDVQAEEEFLRDAHASDVVGKRPPPTDQPTKVKVAVFVKDIALIDDAEQTFTANIVIVCRWLDKRLADPTQEIRELPVNSVWNPLLTIVNERDLKAKDQESVFVQSEGHVLYVQRYTGTFTVPLNLQDFPLDKHKLYIRLQSFYTPEEITFVIDENLTGWADKLSIPDWIVSNGQAKIQAASSKLARREHVQFEFSFEIERLLGFYLWKIILPLTLIVFISWGVFWIDPKRLEAQIGLSATTFLTLFAFQFAIAALIPRIAYLTRMDRYTMLCSLLIFSSILVAVATSQYVKKGRENSALKLQWAARFIFPLAFLVIVVYSFIL